MHGYEEATPDKTRIRSEYFLLAVLLGSVLIAVITGSPSVLLFGGLLMIAVSLWYFVGARPFAAPVRDFLARRSSD